MSQQEKGSRPQGVTSKYASKRASGRQMYGPGCCAHSVTPAQIETRKREADKLRRIEQFDAIVARASRGSDALSLNFPG